MKYDEIKIIPDFEKVTINFFNETYKRFYENHLRLSDKVWAFLFTINAGGAIAVLSFIGSSKFDISIDTKGALCLYILGVILLGIMMAIGYHRALNAVLCWNRKTKDFYKNEMDWEDLTRPRVTTCSKIVDVIIYVCAYGSFVCFILGSLAGGFALFKTI